MLSIIVPVYNADKYIEECIQSILSQTYENFELLLIDDGSTDQSLKICNKFKRIDKRVKVFQKPNGGVSSARNLGLEKSKGDLISFCDADDIIDRKAYEILLDNFKKNNVDRIVGGYKYLYPDGHCLCCKERLDDGIYFKDNLLPKMIDDGTLSGFLFSGVNNSIFKKNIISNNKIKFNENIKYNEDSLFSFEYLLNSNSIYSLQSVPLYFYRQHDLSATKKSYVKDKYVNLHIELERLCKNKTEINYEEQIKRRMVTESFWEILDICKELNGKKAIKEIKKIMKKNNTYENIKLLYPKKMNKYKRFFYYLIKYNCHFMLYLSIKRLVPLFSKYLSR